MTTAALQHSRQIAQEMNGEVVYALGRQPAVLRTFSQRLSRGFNDAINGFNDDGWSLVACDGVEDVVIATNLTKKTSGHANSANGLSVPGGVICAKASMLLQKVPPALLVRFLREHRSEWADYNIDAYSAASLNAGSCSFSGLRPTRFSGSQIILPLAHTVENEEFLEVLRVEGQTITEEEAMPSRVIHLLQLCSGIDENALGACFQLVFAPIDELLLDDAPLLPSGFRVIPLDTKTDGMPPNRTLDLASSLEEGSGANRSDGDTPSNEYSSRSILTIAFQFPYGVHLQDCIAAMARQYVRSIVSAVQRISIAIAPSRLDLNMGQNLLSRSPEAATLARWICQSYNYHLGVDFLRSNCETGESLLKILWHHQDAILCCSLKVLPVFTFANQAGLDMLETSLVALQDITLDKIFDEPGRKTLCSEFAKLMEQGYAYLPAGVCLSGIGRLVSYEQAVAWKVLGEDSSLHCLAFSFINWSFV